MSDIPEMVERVARAICAMRGDDPDAPCRDRFTDKPLCFPLWRRWEGEARAAIEAMREPTEAMVKDGTETHTLAGSCATDYGYSANPDEIAEIWRTMIGTARST